MSDDARSQPEPAPNREPARRFPTVGIGASAGGVRALQEFFERLPGDVDAAFVVVMHLDPAHQSDLAAILASRTRMPVVQVADRVRLEPSHVYVIPPNRQLLVSDQHLATAEFDEARSRHAPIDLFFRSLAAQSNDDFAIIMSGAGSDGAVGVKAIKEAGGIILVQDPDEAEYASMPRNAIATGLADFVLSLREIAAQLPQLIDLRKSIPKEPLAGSDEQNLQHILTHLRARTGHDFSKYKCSTVRRRIARRMQVQHITTLPEYLESLHENAEEAQALFADLLISVTAFFRDADAFKRLAELVIPKLFEGKSAGDFIRVWVAGCATGEEAYSIAILLKEEAHRRAVAPEIQVFASDLDNAALTVAREGRYPLTIEANVAEDRLRHFFTRESGHYRVRRELREIVLFARHSLLKDPPFSRLDLVSCRNLLIYLDRELQQLACAAIHYGLRPGGFLFLGSAENADSPLGMFRLLDRDARIYESMPASDNDVRVAQALATVGVRPESSPTTLTTTVRAPTEGVAHREALERLAPPSAVVDDSYRVLHLSETAGRYLQPSAGTLTNDITELAREELRFDLRAALHRGFARSEATLSAPIAVRFDGAQRRVYFQVRPLPSDPGAARSALVFFFEGESLNGGSNDAKLIEERTPDEQIRELQQELRSRQSQLRASREEYEGANEELRAANEELQSINEEYRSTAEELETSKEELQSINEELETVNSELKSKLESMSRAHSDIQNLMAATDVGILFLDTNLRIKRFTPPVANIFHIKPGDEGRSITDFTHSLTYDGLETDSRAVLRDLASTEREVRSRNGSWFLMRLRPYRTVDDKIDGVVITYVDISERRRADDALRESEARIRAVIDGVADAIITIDENQVIRSLNKATTKMFGYAPGELLGHDVSMLMPEPHASQHAFYIKNYIRSGVSRIIGVGREVEARRKDGALFPVELMVSEIRHEGERLFIGFLRDLSETRRFEARLQKLHSNRLVSMAQMATTLAHEINQPLAAATAYLAAGRRLLAADKEQLRPEVEDAFNNTADQMLRAGKIISHLREFIARGEPDKTVQRLHELVRQAAALTLPSIRQAKIELKLYLQAANDLVLVDRVQMEQAIVNLIRNAVDAMSGSPRRELAVSTWLEDGVIHAEVVDTGVGLPETIDIDLFEPFTSTKPEGLGVGLSIARAIIEAHYGKIWAESNPGGGARFHFTLPLADTEILAE
jgi:two-component system, chemotaxis family, CheB/CheR fusion protein